MSGVAIVDYGINNVRSVRNAVEYCGFDPIVTHDADVIADASHVILPGVGAFGDAMNNIRDRGIDEILDRHVTERANRFWPSASACNCWRSPRKSTLTMAIPHRGLGWFDADVRAPAAQRSSG